MSLDVPAAPKRPYTITQHGETRTDNYFWMRYRDDPSVLAYLNEENGYCEAMTAHTKALQERLYAEMRGRIKEADVSVPEQHGDYLYYARTEQGLQYRTCCRKPHEADAAEEILLDQNAMAAGHSYFRVGVFSPSPNNRWLAYAIDVTGDEVYTIAIKDMQTGEVLPARIPNTTYGLAWANDSRSFFYTVLDAAKRPYKVYRHVLGRDPAQDKLMYHEGDELFSIYVDKTADDAYILINLHAFGSTEVRVLPADGPAVEGEFAVFQPRQPNLEYDIEHVNHDGDQFLVVTNWDAVNFRLMVSPVNATTKEHWRELIPHRADVFLQKVIPFKDAWVRLEREGSLRRIRYSKPDLSELREIEFPEPTFTWNTHSHQNFASNTLRFTYTSLVTPNSVIDFDLNAHAWQLRKQDEIPSGYDASQYRSERIWATAPDGAKVPISLIYRLGALRPGPLLLYGYGSYGSPVDPAFNASRLSLLDRGVAFAIAHVRGGNEMGRQWYDDGKLMRKKNTFTDFIACAEHLIALGFTSPEQLAIQGKSAGGLLVGAAMTLRPDLFCSVIADVPFVDVVSTMSDASIPLTAQEWEQWGNPANKEFYDYMKSYSPYDNVRETTYPALLLKAGWVDPRVQYWEPAKFAAKLRELKTDHNPLLLKTNMSAGHFGSSGRFDFLKEVAFDMAFVLDQFDVVW
jgi:oligopeptidase B